MTDRLSRRCFLGGAAASAVAAIPVATLALTGDDTRPITPAEYLAEMESHGWHPVTGVVSGRPSGVFEHCLNKPPTVEDMAFHRRITGRVFAGFAGDERDYASRYERIAEYLFEQGRIDSPWPAWCEAERAWQ